MSFKPYRIPDELLQVAERKWREAVDDEALSGGVPDPIGLMAQMAFAERQRALKICEDRKTKHRLAAKLFGDDEASACSCLESAIEAMEIAKAIQA